MIRDKMNDELRDPLTGLYRAWFALDPADLRSRRLFAPERAVPWLDPLPDDAVFVGFDLCDFKAVNDQYGLPVGQAVLAEIGRRLIRAADPWPAYRSGGDEFLVAARARDVAAVRALASSIRAALEHPVEGVVVATRVAAARASGGQTPEALVLSLDRALSSGEARLGEIVVVQAASAAGASSTQAVDSWLLLIRLPHHTTRCRSRRQGATGPAARCDRSW
jgi:diguanylate cyclase (GGDEF)-like protein